MNRENILAVADAIEQHSIPELGFNMYDYVCDAEVLDRRGLSDMSGSGCGTTACIAGWAKAIALGRTPQNYFGVHEDAQHWLGLSLEQADTLFYGLGRGIISLPDISSAHAVSVLRHLAETGEVDWSVSP